MKIMPIAAATALATVALTGCTTVREAVTEAIAGSHTATLTGASVVGAARDADGYATAQLTVADKLDSICYDVNDLRGTGDVTSATINRGAPGRNGPVVLTLTRDETGDWKKCVNRSEWLENALGQSPQSYYIQVNTTTGALRGQFAR